MQIIGTIYHQAKLRPHMTHIKTRLFALAATAGIIGINGYLWHKASTDGIYWPKASFFFPFVACLMFALVISPISREENIKKYGQAQMPIKHMPLALKIAVVIGIALGITQCAHFAGKI
jgi:hypothetical protein